MEITHCKNLKIIIFFAGAGVFLTSAFLFLNLAKAQTGDAQIQAAINELGSVTGQDITTEDQARDLCNQEQYLDICTDIGKKHNLYTEEEVVQVDAFLNEVKGQVLADIKACQNEECLIRVANQLAQKVQVNNPTLATNFKLTTAIIDEKNSVIQAAIEVGVNFKDCEAMNPDTAPVDLLRKCAKLAKDSRVQNYIPEDKRVLAGQFEDSAAIKLREALEANKYQCGDNTVEGCGNFCLNQQSGAGLGAIPLVCRQIATEIFGPDGVRSLEASYQQVGQIKDYYSNKFSLILPDGKEIIGEKQIKDRCAQAFSNRNLEVAKVCGSFAVKNGFATQVEVDKGVKLLESFTQKSGDVDFNTCLSNPASCRNFIPEDEVRRFDVNNSIFEIMKSEIGFDPSQCERGAVDETVRNKCFEGSKRALVKIESLGLANQSLEARSIIEDIRRHVAEGENMIRRKDEFRQVFIQEGGPGGCRSESECFTYCSDPVNGPECISFGAKQSVTGFTGQGAVERFNEYNQNLQRPGFSGDFINRYSPLETYLPSQQFPGQTFVPAPGVLPQSQFPDQRYPTGPNPECLAAIQSGDFVRAKTVCVSSVVPVPTNSISVCPVTAYVECPAGQYRESAKNSNGCWVDGPCKAIPSYTPYPTLSSGPYPTYTPPVGQKNQIWNGKGLSSYVRADADPIRIERLKTTCADVPSGANVWMPRAGDFASNDFGMPDSVKCQKASACAVSQYFDGANCVSTGPSPIFSSSPYPTYSYSPLPSTGASNDPGGCFYPNATKDGESLGWTVWCEKDYFNCHLGDYKGDSVGLTGLSLGAPSSCYGATSTPGSYPTYSPYPSSGTCPSGYHSHGDFCMNDQENYSGTCYDSVGTTKITCPTQPSYSPVPTSTNTCSQTLISVLGSGCHFMFYDSSGKGVYCDGPMTKSASYGDVAATPGCGDSTTSTPTPSCPAAQYWNGNACVGSTTTYSPTPNTSYTPPSSCPSGQWWDYATSSCKDNTSYGGCTGTTQSSCTSTANCYWDSATNYCYYQSTSPGTATYTPYPSCPSGQWWDYATSSCKTTTPYDTPTGGYCGDYACNNGETASSCPSDCGSTATYTPPPSCPSSQYWDGSACVANPTPYPTSTYTPPPSESPPPPTSTMYQSYIVAHCQQLGRTWNGEICQANGLFARFFESSGLANILRSFSLVP